MSNFIFIAGIIGVLVIGLVLILIIGLDSLKKYLLVSSPFLILGACSTLCLFFSKYLFPGEPLLNILLYILLIFTILYIVSWVANKTDQSKKEDASEDKDGSSQSSQTNQNSTQWSKEEPVMEDGLRKRSRIFMANGAISDTDSEKKELYTSAVSVIALFSWMMRRDGFVDEVEMNVARLYFQNHLTYSRILRLGPDGKGWDPVLGINRTSIDSPVKLLDYYNTCLKLLRYETCCRNILASGIYYGAVLDLLKALLQVAYSSDGVIDSEMKILRGIAENLKVKKEDWKLLLYKCGFRNTSSYAYEGNSDEDMNARRNKTSENQGKSSSKEEKNNDGNGKKRSDGEESKRKEEKLKSSTYGYKITQAYNQLGLLSTASEQEIKTAFRLLVKKYHPDHLPSDATDMDRKISADQFRQIMEAYDLIRLEKGM